MRYFQTRQDLIFVIIAAAISLVPIWSTTLLPMGDLGHHVAVAAILRDYLKVQLYKDAFIFTNWYSTNTTVYLLFAGLFQFFAPETAARIVVSAYVVALPFSFFYMLRSLRGPTWPAIISVAFIFNHSFNGGYINFLISIPLFFLGVGLHINYFCAPSRKKAIACLGLLLILYWTHMVTYGFLMLVIFSLAFVTGKVSPKELAKKYAMPIISTIPAVAWLCFYFLAKVETYTRSSSVASSFAPSYLDPRVSLGQLFGDSQLMIHSKIEGYLVYAIFFSVLVAIIVSIRWGNRISRLQTVSVVVFLTCLIWFLICPDRFKFNLDIAPRFVPFVWLSALAMVQYELPKKGRAAIIGLFLILAALNSAWLTTGFIRFRSDVDPVIKMAEMIEPQTRIYKAIYNRNDQSIFSNGGVYWHLDKYFMAWRNTLNNDILPIQSTCLFQYRKVKAPPTLKILNFFDDKDLPFYDYVITFDIPKSILKRATASKNVKPRLIEGKWGLFSVVKKR
jgi:hypothetical protein